MSLIQEALILSYTLITSSETLLPNNITFTGPGMRTYQTFQPITLVLFGICPASLPASRPTAGTELGLGRDAEDHTEGDSLPPEELQLLADMYWQEPKVKHGAGLKTVWNVRLGRGEFTDRGRSPVTKH